MGQDFFEFSPCFKLVWSGNSKPTLNRVDEAIRRRLNLITFTVTIPRNDREPAVHVDAEARPELGPARERRLEDLAYALEARVALAL